MSQDSATVIVDLNSQCLERLNRLTEATKEHCSDKELAEDLKRVNSAFRLCYVFSSPHWDGRLLVDIGGGIDRYPKTASFLIGALQDLEQNLVKAKHLPTEERQGGPTAQGEDDQSIQSSDDPETLNLELQRLCGDIAGTVSTICMIRDLLYPMKDSFKREYHDHALADFERRLAGVTQYDKDGHEAPSTEVAEGAGAKRDTRLFRSNTTTGR